MKSRMSDVGKSTESAQQAQREANTMGLNEDDEKAAQKRLEETGEPVRDRLGNEDGSS
jgi:hypothetical protein